MTFSDSFAQSRSAVRIIAISGDDGTPIGGANAILFRGESEDFDNMQDAGVTNSDGLYEFDRIDPGLYTLKVSFVGHQTYTETLNLEAGERIVRRITLEFESAEFDEVVVEGRRQISTGEVGVRRITSLDIDRVPTPVAGGDLSSYLQTVPGVVTTGDRGGDLYIRGGNPTQNLVLVDNMQIFKPFHISNLYSAFPGNLVQNVDLYAGGYAAEYSGATSAIIDVSLRNGNMRRHQSSVSVSPYLTSLHYEGPLERDRQSLLVQGRFSTIERYSEAIIGEEQPFDFYDITAKYALQTESATCNITAMRTYDSGRIDRFRDLELSWENNVAGMRCLGYDERFNYPIDITLGYMNYRNGESAGGNQETSSAISDLYVRLDHKEQIFGYPLDYGLFIGFRSYNTELAERFSDVRFFSADRSLVKGYVQLEYSVFEGFTVQPGITSQLTLQTSPSFEPRLRMAYKFGERFAQEISLAGGIYNQTFEGITDTRDVGTVFTVISPNENQKPLPRAVHAIAGYEISTGPVQLNLEGYVKDHSNIPVSKWTPLARVEIETAFADGLTYGFDARLEVEAGEFYGYAGYGYSTVEYEAISESLGAWVEEDIFSYNPAHDQRHKLNILGSYRLAGFTTNVSWEFASGRPFTKVYGFDLSLRTPEENPMTDAGTARTLFSRPYGERLPVQHKLDISVQRSFDVGESLSFSSKIGAINTYNRNNIFYYNLNTLQRIDQTPFMPYLSIEANIN